MGTLEDWLLPFVAGVKSAEDWKKFDILPALKAKIGWDHMQMMDQSVPSGFKTPLGRVIPIDYDDAQPKISVRLQEMFGVTRHPTAGGMPIFSASARAGKPRFAAGRRVINVGRSMSVIRLVDLHLHLLPPPPGRRNLGT